ncbi:sigma-70 family RNA polymerase sigma factor [Clostridium sp.]|uniref:sigma-70 family RNA polymerase sigma factor n=1 Tax=Clostridium sp. TaxID=1506 RepID=UPI003EED3A9D
MDIKLLALWEEFSIPLRKFISKRISNQQNAEDILQEVFLKINSNIEALKDKQKLQSWIYSIARNTIIDFYRKNSILEIELPDDLINMEISSITNIKQKDTNLVNIINKHLHPFFFLHVFIYEE